MNNTINKVKVRNMKSPNSGSPVANQFVITTDEGNYFQSYDSIIAFRPYNHVLEGAQIVLDEAYWDYSVTTGKYRNQFLNEGIADTRKKIEAGIYKLADLN